MHSATSTASRTAASGRPGATFARRRLRLGITGVGASVVLSFALLIATLAGAVPLTAEWRVVKGPIGVPLTAAALALALFVGHAALLAVVEHTGGRRAVRTTPSLGAWVSAWLRGVVVLGSLMVVSTSAVATAGAIAGTVGAAATSCGIAFALLLMQAPLARLTAALTVSVPSEDVVATAQQAGIDAVTLRVVDANDEAVVGGWMGWGAHELWIPAWWTRAEHADLLLVQLHRRAAQRISRGRQRGWFRAALWPAIGVLLTASLMPYSWQDARLWLLLPALGTIWSFAAVVLLPSMSRPVVHYADALAARAVGTTRTMAAIARLDAAQDDEPERSPVVEVIFHPVPSVANRRRRLLADRVPPNGGGHQQTRLTLFASLAAGSVLGRMVHCNIGRPALWVAYPGD
jgi:hypothetical protein